MSANETTLHPSHNLKKLTIIGQGMAFNTKYINLPTLRQMRFTMTYIDKNFQLNA